MKYLMTIMLIVLSINTFAKDDNYVVCSERKIKELTKCVNDYIDKGYEPKSGLHGFSRGQGAPFWFQALIKK